MTERPFQHDLETYSLIEKIELAKKTALSEEELGELDTRQADFRRKFFAGQIGLDEYMQQETETSRALEAGVLEVASLDELKHILPLLRLSDEVIEETVRHEEDHWREAERFGLKANFGIRFIKQEGPDQILRLLSNLKIPPDLDEPTARDILEKIIRAPGVDMSPHDRLSLDQE